MIYFKLCEVCRGRVKTRTAILKRSGRCINCKNATEFNDKTGKNYIHCTPCRTHINQYNRLKTKYNKLLQKNVVNVEK
jgi:hypothetical protein